MFSRSKTKIFEYTIPELSIFHRSFFIKLNECKTADDLKKNIAHNLSIKNDDLYFESVPNQKLKKIDGCYDFKLIYRSPHPNIDFILPSGKQIHIIDCYNKKFSEIFPFFEKEGNYYTHLLIQKGIYFIDSNNNSYVQRNTHPFLSLKKNEPLKLKFNGKVNILKYGNCIFYASDNEKSVDVKKLVQNAYPNLRVSITDKNGNKPEILNSKEKYYIHAEKFVEFINIHKPSESEFISVDYFDSILDVRESLATKMNVNDPKDLIIYDSNKKQIHVLKQPFRNFESLNSEFYFHVNQENKESEKVKKVENKQVIKKLPKPKVIKKRHRHQYTDASIQTEYSSAHNNTDYSPKIITDNSDDYSYVCSNLFISSNSCEEAKPNANTQTEYYQEYLNSLDNSNKNSQNNSNSFNSDIFNSSEELSSVEIFTMEISAGEIFAGEISAVEISTGEISDGELNQNEQSNTESVLNNHGNRIHTLPWIFYEFLTITLVFLENYREKMHSINKQFSIKTHIIDIINMISKNYNTQDKITIKYKNNGILNDLSEFDTVEQVKNKITEIDDDRNIKYVMYVEVKTKIEEYDLFLTDEDSDKPKNEDKELLSSGMIELMISSSSSDLEVKKEQIDLNPKKNNDETDQIIRKKSQKRRTSVSQFRPKAMQKSSKNTWRPHPLKTKSIPNTSFYIFEFKGRVKEINLRDDVTIECEEEKIKKVFDIFSNEKLIYKFESDVDKKVYINILDKKMSSFKKGIIIIDIYTKNSQILAIDISEINKLTKIKKLKNDEFVKIYEVCSRTNSEQKYILKVMNKISFDHMTSFLNEHEILRLLDHRYILETRGIFLSDANNPASIVFEHYIGNLERIKNINQEFICKIIYNIAEGMKYVHSKNIIHRNLSPKSIFITDDNEIKIGEFGISKLITLEEQLNLSSRNILGDMQYVAPELSRGEEYNEKVDVYSFGVLVLYLLNDAKLPAFNHNLELREQIPKTFTKYATEFIGRCISADANDRPSFEKICKDFNKNRTKIFQDSQFED